MRQIRYKRYHFDCDGKLITVTEWGRIIKLFRVYEDSETCFTSPSNIGNTDNFTDCQFINMADKNGVEIYEGNIVEIENTGLLIVCFYKGEFKLQTLVQYHKKRNIYASIYHLEFSVFRGDIYQNPELLATI